MQDLGDQRVDGAPSGSRAGILVALVLRLLVLLGVLFVATQAHAAPSDEGPTAGSYWPMWAAAGVQVLVALGVGAIQSGRTRELRLTDDRVEMLGKRQDTTEQLLRITREEYARRNEVDVAIQRMDGRMDTIDKRLQSQSSAIQRLDGRMDASEKRMDAMDKKLETIDQNIHRLISLVQAGAR